MCGLYSDPVKTVNELTAMTREDDDHVDDIEAIDARYRRELSWLFGSDTVEQAALIDVVDLNMNEEMTRCISAGVTQLKKLRGQPGAQREFIQGRAPAERMLLCMWIMEMGLLDKLQTQGYAG